MQRTQAELAEPLKIDRGRVKVISTLEQWREHEGELLAILDTHPVLGFDAEWVNSNRAGSPANPIALIQLSTLARRAYLVRLCEIGHVPVSLKQVLAGERCLKFGVGVQEDSVKLFQDYGVGLAHFVDLRHFLKGLRPQGLPKTGLAGLAMEFLGATMDKDWRVRAGDWEAAELSDRQIEYAANDAHYGLNVGLAMALEANAPRLLDVPDEERLSELANGLIQISLPFAGQTFKLKSKPAWPSTAKKETSYAEKMKHMETKLAYKCPAGRAEVRKSQMYFNVKLEAPDGQPLCTMNEKKALWYVEKGLGHIVREEPLTVRLKFEPAGRPAGADGAYYLEVMLWDYYT